MSLCRKFVCILLVFSIGCVLLAGCTDEPKTYWEPKDSYPDLLYIDPAGDIPPIHTNRSTWNIEVVYHSTTDFATYFDINDYDNLGFVHYAELAKLEKKQKNDQWEIIFDYPIISDSSIAPEPGYVPPQSDGYASTRTVIAPQKKGHYRFTQKIYDREFTCEFDVE